jgi:uncharacterized membrane protein YheB (UPF0754 family)
VTREELEKQIAAVSRDIDILNQKIADVIRLAKERDKLREELQDMIRQYLGQCFREKLESHNVVFAFNGKIKDLLKELEKAQKYNPSSF